MKTQPLLHILLMYSINEVISYVHIQFCVPTTEFPPSLYLLFVTFRFRIFLVYWIVSFPYICYCSRGKRELLDSPGPQMISTALYFHCCCLECITSCFCTRLFFFSQSQSYPSGCEVNFFNLKVLQTNIQLLTIVDHELKNNPSCILLACFREK